MTITISRATRQPMTPFITKTYYILMLGMDVEGVSWHPNMFIEHKQWRNGCSKACCRNCTSQANVEILHHFAPKKK